MFEIRRTKQGGSRLFHGCYGSFLYSKSVRGLVQWSLRDLHVDTPRPLVAKPQAFGSLNRVETLDSASNYYLDLQSLSKFTYTVAIQNNYYVLASTV